MNTIKTIEQMVEAQQEALEALEENHHLIEEHERSDYLALYDRRINSLSQAIQAGRALLEQLQSSEDLKVQEPVAWEMCEDVFWHTDQGLNDYIRENGTPLYTHPQPAQPKEEDMNTIKTIEQMIRSLIHLLAYAYLNRPNEIDKAVAVDDRQDAELAIEAGRALLDALKGQEPEHDSEWEQRWPNAETPQPKEPLTDEHIVDTSWVAARDRYAEAAHGIGKGEA